LIAAKNKQNKKETIKMKSKTKTNKVPKPAKTRLGDLTPKKDARGGMIPTDPPSANPARGTLYPSKSGSHKVPLTSRRQVTS
jgi:hypothetical protein